MKLSRQQIIAISLVLLPIAIIWLVNGIYLAALARISVTYFWLADLVQWVVVPSMLLMFLAKKMNIHPSHYGLNLKDQQWRFVLLESLAMFVTAGLAYYLTLKVAYHVLHQPTGYFSFPGVFPDGLMGKVIWLYSGVSAGLIESIFFVGLPWLLYQNIRSEPSPVIFTLLATGIFALAHWEQGPHNIIAAFSFNLVACAWYFRGNSLWPLIIGHALIDLADFV